MTTQPQTVTSLTARRQRLEVTRTDLAARLKARAAELELLSGQEPDEANVTAFIEAQREHRDVTEALERTEHLIEGVDGELERLNTAGAHDAKVEELAAAVREALENRGALQERMAGIGEYLKTELSACLEHRARASRLRTKLHGLIGDLAPGSRYHGSYYFAEPGQVERAERFAADFGERYGLDLQDAFEGGASYPEPFGAALEALLDGWARVRDLEEFREEERLAEEAKAAQSL